ncbi:MAG TPA: peptidase M75, partial [Sulfitobacter pontiacus]|nr:peptidase M75 [Sulfitobacter pontiacus]
MKKLVLALGLFCAPLGAAAEVGSAVLRDVVDHHILPRYTT